MVKYDFKAILKVIFIGDPAVGKTSIVKRYVTGEFTKEYISTIGVDIYSLKDEIDIHGKRVQLIWQIWDLAGHPMWYEIRSATYRGAHSAIVVYDITRRETYEHVLNWLEELMKGAGKRPIVLVANKIDMRRKVKTVTKREGLKLKRIIEKNIGIPVEFVETSALTGVNIPEVFRNVAYLLLKDVVSGGNE